MLLDAGLGVDAAAVVAAVGSAAAVEGAGAAERAEDVVAAAAVERVGAVVGKEGVRAAAAGDQVRAAGDVMGRRADVVEVGPAGVGYGVVPVLDEVRVVGAVANDRIHAVVDGNGV